MLYIVNAFSVHTVLHSPPPPPFGCLIISFWIWHLTRYIHIVYYYNYNPSSKSFRHNLWCRRHRSKVAEPVSGVQPQIAREMTKPSRRPHNLSVEYAKSIRDGARDFPRINIAEKSPGRRSLLSKSTADTGGNDRQRWWVSNSREQGPVSIVNRRCI